MRQWLLEELRCPVCRSNLHLESAVPIKYQVDNSGEIEEGLIQCESCHAQYPINCILSQTVGVT